MRCTNKDLTKRPILNETNISRHAVITVKNEITKIEMVKNENLDESVPHKKSKGHSVMKKKLLVWYKMHEKENHIPITNYQIKWKAMQLHVELCKDRKCGFLCGRNWISSFKKTYKLGSTSKNEVTASKIVEQPKRSNNFLTVLEEKEIMDCLDAIAGNKDDDQIKSVPITTNICHENLPNDMPEKTSDEGNPNLESNNSKKFPGFIWAINHFYIEIELYMWYESQQKSSSIIHSEELQQKITEIHKSKCNNPLCQFKASQNFVNSFTENFHIRSYPFLQRPDDTLKAYDTLINGYKEMKMPEMTELMKAQKELFIAKMNM